jgi:hypothetical protein
MRFDQKEKPNKRSDNLSRTDKICFNLAIMVAAAATLSWIFKILLF